MLENAINIANDRITQKRCAETGKSAVTAFTVMWRRMFRTQPNESRHPQIRQSWLSSAAQMVGLIKKYRAITSYVSIAPVAAMRHAPNRPASRDRVVTNCIEFKTRAARQRASGPQVLFSYLPPSELSAQLRRLRQGKHRRRVARRPSIAPVRHPSVPQLSCRFLLRPRKLRLQ